MKDLIHNVKLFAESSHRGQIRKYTGEDYVTHPFAVADIVMDMLREVNISQMYYMGNYSQEEVYAAAILHDVVEDCDVTNGEIAEMFGPRIALLVDGLTDDKIEKNRKLRKEHMMRKHNSMPGIVRFIKVADLIHNMRSIMVYDKDFGVVFLREVKNIRANEMFMHTLPYVAALMLDTHIAFAECVIEKHLKDKEQS